jgi:hypothetical protein
VLLLQGSVEEKEEAFLIQALIAFIFLLLSVVGFFFEKFKRLEKIIEELEENYNNKSSQGTVIMESLPVSHSEISKTKCVFHSCV